MACSNADTGGEAPDAGMAGATTFAGASVAGAAGMNAGGSVSGTGGQFPSPGGSAPEGGTSTLAGAAGTSQGAASGAALGGAPTAGAGGTQAAAGTAGTGAGAGGAGGGGGTPGSGAFEPCPAGGAPCLILPFGDSITNGVGSSDLAGYRSKLFDLMVKDERNVRFVGSLRSGPDQVGGAAFPKNHEGHSGWTIDSGYVSFGDGISKLVPSPAFDTVPHIVLLMIGTNDVSASQGTSTIHERLDNLLGKITGAAPNALVVVAQITPIGWNPAARTAYNARLPGLVEARASQGQHVVLVDMGNMPSSGLSSDSLHPNDSGYGFMARTWYDAIASYLD